MTDDPGTRPQLLGLGDILPGAGLLDRPEALAIASWLHDPAGTGALWVHGPPGSGRSQAVAAALRDAAPRFLGAKRVACFEGLSLDEALYETSVLLRQVGSTGLA